MADRFEKRQKQHKLDEISKKGRSIEDIQEEEELLKNTEKVKPIKGSAAAGRNDPCPCGSGKKFKKCCGQEK
jgi:uncharacterized protein YecA (UPF0149 family)